MLDRMLRLIPLGGLGEVGLNALAIESNGELLLIDCGVLFPPAGASLGVELLVPDFTFLFQNRDRLKGVVLTHGHEDHLGALPFLLRQLDVPVFATKLTLGLARPRLEEHGLGGARLEEISCGTAFELGEAFKIEPVRVCHSVPDAVGLLVGTQDGTIVHTGDFKLDGAPVSGWPTDLDRFGQAGDEGVLCLLSDSTNAEEEGPPVSEAQVLSTLERLLQGARGRVVVSLFASNLQRVQGLLSLAERLGRKVGLLGRSMARNVELARSLGYLRVADNTLLPLEDLGKLPPERVLLLATGAQAEPRSGLSQLSMSNDGPVALETGDLVVLSARAIPGNERAVTALIDRLLELGAKVVYPAIEPGVHASGHAYRPELRRMLQTVRPKHFIPVHGELHHLHQHLELARELGAAPGGALLAKNGDVVAFDSGRTGIIGRVPSGRVPIDRTGALVGAQALKERSRLSEEGLVAVALVLDRTSRELLGKVRVNVRGAGAENAPPLLELSEEVAGQVLELSPAVRLDDALLEETVVRAVRSVFKRHGQGRPAVMPLVIKH